MTDERLEELKDGLNNILFIALTKLTDKQARENVCNDAKEIQAIIEQQRIPTEEVSNCKSCVGCECEPSLGQTINDCNAYVFKRPVPEEVQKQVETLSNMLRHAKDGLEWETDSDILRLYHDKINALKFAIQALRQMQGWIPVNNENDLPAEKSCHYLVITKMHWAHGENWDDNNGDHGRNVAVAYFNCTGAFNMPYITHWMPLPMPPKGEKHE